MPDNLCAHLAPGANPVLASQRCSFAVAQCREQLRFNLSLSENLLILSNKVAEVFAGVAVPARKADQRTCGSVEAERIVPSYFLLVLLLNK